MSYETIPPAMVAEMEEDMAAAIDAEGDGMTEERRDMFDKFAAFLLDLADFPPARLYATVQMLKNLPLDATAAELGCSSQNVFALQKCAMKKLPILRTLVRRVRVAQKTAKCPA